MSGARNFRMKEDFRRFGGTRFWGGYWRFDNYMQENFKPGGKVSDLIGWLRSNEFSEPENARVVWDDIEERRSGYTVENLPSEEEFTVVQYSYKNFDSLCGLTKYQVFWIADDQGLIRELKHRVFRCVFDLP